MSRATRAALQAAAGRSTPLTTTIGTPVAGTLLSATSAATSLAVPYPASVAANDLLVMVITNSGGAITDPSGWTKVYSEATVSNPKGGMWIKKATGSETGTLAVAQGSSTAAAQMFKISGVHTSSPLTGTPTNIGNNTAGTTAVIPTLTTDADHALLLFAAGSTNTQFTGGSATEAADFVQAGASNGAALYYEVLGAAGATGSRTVTLSASRRNWGAMCALRPA